VNIRFLIALAAILFSALPSLAQTNVGWDTRFFATTNKPIRVHESNAVIYASDVIISQMIHAVNERYVATTKDSTWTVFDTFQINYKFYIRKPEIALIEIKQGIKQILPHFVQSYSETNFSPGTIVYYNSTNILLQLGLPPDFFDVTPVRNLMGNSAFATNSVAYGWDGAYRCINLLINTFESGVFAKYEERGTCSISGAGLSENETGVFSVFNPPELEEFYGIQESSSSYNSPTNITAQTTRFDYGKKTYRTISENLFDEYPYIVTNAIAKTFDFEGFGFDIFPGPENYSPRGFNVCPRNYAYALPNQDVYDQISENCVSNVPYVASGQITYTESLLNNGYVYPLPQSFTEGGGLRCSASQIIASMQCYAQFEEFDSSVILGCDGDTEIFFGADGFKNAQTAATINFANIVTWGFRYK
jgi:hypothetical protein